MSEKLVLEHGSGRAVFDTRDGCRLTRLVLGGHSLLVEDQGQDPMWWGAFVMAPWTSLLRRGDFEFDASRHRVAEPDSDDAWHGVARNRTWSSLEGDSSETWTVVRTTLGVPWPLGGTVELRAELDENELTLKMAVTAGDRRMPAACGWHPWFRRSLDVGHGVEVRVAESALAQERDAAGRPTGDWIAPTRRWNDCVRDAGPIELAYAGAGILRVHYSSDFVTLFSSDLQGVCVEPVTSAAEQMNDVLEPGEQLTLDIRLEWLPEMLAPGAGKGAQR